MNWIKTSEELPPENMLVLGFWPRAGYVFGYPEKPVYFGVCWREVVNFAGTTTVEWRDADYIYSDEPGLTHEPSHWAYLEAP